MIFLEKTVNITKVVLATRVLPTSNTATKTNRPWHGLAFITRPHESIYTFSDGKEIVCNYGDLIYLPKNSSYKNRINEKDFSVFKENTDTVYCINFLIDEEIDADPFKLNFKTVDILKNEFDKSALSWKRMEIGYEEKCRAALYRIIAECKTVYTKRYQSSKQRKILEPALEYIANNFYDEKIQIPALSQMCGISETYFRRLFASEFGVSPAIYIVNKRIAFAKELLEFGEYSVTDTSIAAGFNDTAYFSRKFKEHTGMSPVEYIKHQKLDQI